MTCCALLCYAWENGAGTFGCMLIQLADETVGLVVEEEEVILVVVVAAAAETL